MSKKVIWVVSGDMCISSSVFNLLSPAKYTIQRVESDMESEQHSIRNPGLACSPTVILLEISPDAGSGLDALAHIRRSHPSVPVIIVSPAGRSATVTEAVKMGASGYLAKPLGAQDLELAIESALNKRSSEVEREAEPPKLRSMDDFLSANPNTLRIREIAKRVADIDVPVMITGESGVGKEVVARFIHAQSDRRNRPFIKVNCAALPHDLLESELFGYERGAFTGAVQQKPGKFELADKGFILLDEIGEMNLLLQAKLLHVLQDLEFSRLGGKHQVKVNARVLATTNRRLEEAVWKGEFREDLYFRLNVIRIDIPPLRERKDEIRLLCDYFFQKYRDQYKSPVRELPLELLEVFHRYDWPGNIRELKNAIQRYLILPDSETVISEFRQPGAQSRNLACHDVSLKDMAAQAVEQVEMDAVLRMLEDTHWNRKQAARRLNICYKALLNKLKKWQIDERSNGHNLRVNRGASAEPENHRAAGERRLLLG